MPSSFLQIFEAWPVSLFSAGTLVMGRGIFFAPICGLSMVSSRAQYAHPHGVCDSGGACRGIVFSLNPMPQKRLLYHSHLRAGYAVSYIKPPSRKNEPNFFKLPRKFSSGLSKVLGKFQVTSYFIRSSSPFPLKIPSPLCCSTTSDLFSMPAKHRWIKHMKG